MFADTNKLAVVLLNLLNGLWRVLGAIIADRFGNGTVAIDRNVTDRICYATARHAQNQEY